MNEISSATNPELTRIIGALYTCLFDPTKRISSLDGFDDVIDHGITRFKGVENCRRIELLYKGKSYELGLFNYVRDNGNTLGLRNGETDSNFIQYVLDKFIVVSESKISFTHDGVITGNSGKTKDACIEEISRSAPHLINNTGSIKSIALGYLENGFHFEDSAFQKFIANFIEYSILRNNFKNHKMDKINLKEKFIKWFIKKDGVDTHYFSLQFGSNLDRFTAEITLYEQIYKKDFNTELFVIDIQNYKKQIEDIKANIYGKSAGFSEFSKNNSNGRPMAILGKKNYIRFLNEYFTNEDTESSNLTNTVNEIKVLNQILYGPPGTGKTYSTINKSLAIMGVNTIGETRTDIKGVFEQKVNEKQIVFTTFHQSMSYEDFIEGIKPRTKNENVTYAVEDGVFKSLVKKALIEYIRKETDIDDVTEFDTLYNHFVESIKPLEGKREGTFTTKTGVEIMLVDANNTSILVKYVWSDNSKKDADGQHTFSVTKEKLKKVLLEGIDPAKIKSLKDELLPLIGHIHCELFAVYKKFYEFVIANKGEIETIHFDYEELSFEEVREQFDLLSKEEINAKEVKPYIIIIDEINRGNVSQIFGELITLIEEDKRLGKDEALEVTLPYSKDKFGVPPNVFIIGTMNTADRSVEALDTALRRRFSFTEMMPEYDELYKIQFGSFNLGTVLRKINERIETLLDRDHTIGHSYFINLKSGDTDALKETFFNKIIPLLQEYFYHDYEKMGWVLGQEFIDEVRSNKNDIFGSFYNAQQPDVETTYKLKDFKKLDILHAVEGLLGIKRPVPNPV